MKISQLLDKRAIIADLKSTEKTGAIQELAAAISQNTNGTADQITEVLMGREQLGSTGIGGGIAIPHGKSEGVASLCMAIGLPSTPVDFNSIDGLPVDLIILLASPVDQTGPHIQALAKISRMLMNEDFRTTIKDAKSGEELFKLIADYEADAPV